MATLHVVKPFNLLLNEEEQKAVGATSPMVRFDVGRHDDVHKVIANHPYALLHLGDENAAAAAAKPVTGNALAVDLDAAVRRAEAAEKALQDERAAHAQTRAKLADATAEDAAEDEEPSGIAVRHKGRGLFAVFQGEEQVTEPMPKAEATAKAAEMRARG